MKNIENNQIFSVPKKDKEKRFIIGKKGKKNLLVIALNPSTANIDKHDPTTRNIEKIAKLNGFDGWILFNLCPKRATHPSKLEINTKKNLMNENLTFLNSILYFNEFNISKVWLAWGNNIDKKNKEYFRESAFHMFGIFEKYNCDYLAVGINKTGKGNPTHPSPQAINQIYKSTDKPKLTKFELEKYIPKIKRIIKIKPEISINKNMKINPAQIRHEKLIDFLNQFSQYQHEGKPRCKKLKEQIGTRHLENMDTNDINLGVVALTDFYNLSGGSIGSIDLYQLLQTYFLDKDKREKINEIVMNN